jgi:hypothetical protein
MQDTSASSVSSVIHWATRLVDVAASKTIKSELESSAIGSYTLWLATLLRSVENRLNILTGPVARDHQSAGFW